MDASTSEILVVGGGIVGLSIAYYCADSNPGARITVVDRAGLGTEASWAGAGIVPYRDVERAESAYTRLLASGASEYPSLSKRLLELCGRDNGYRVCGELEIAGETASAAALAERLATYEREGVRVRLRNADEARRLEPALRDGLAAVHELPQTAQLRNPWHLRALAAGCRALGVRFETGASVDEVLTEGDRVTGVRGGERQWTSAATVFAAGAWTAQLLERLDVPLALKPIRGQIALLALPRPVIERVLTVANRYLVPRADGRVLVGSSEEDVGFDKRCTAEVIADLLEFACTLVPRLADATLERVWSGLRPATPDGLPYLGPVPGYRDAIVASGHYRFGIALAPSTGRLVSQLLAGEPPEIPIADFSPERKP